MGSFFWKDIPGNIRGRASKGIVTQGKKESQPKSELRSRLPQWTTGAQSSQGLSWGTAECASMSSTWDVDNGSVCLSTGSDGLLIKGAVGVRCPHSSRFEFVPEGPSRLPATSSCWEGRDLRPHLLWQAAAHEKGGPRGCESPSFLSFPSSISIILSKGACFPLCEARRSLGDVEMSLLVLYIPESLCKTLGNRGLVVGAGLHVCWERLWDPLLVGTVRVGGLLLQWHVCCLPGNETCHRGGYL